MAGKSGFSKSEIETIKHLFLEEGRSVIQIAKILGKGSENSVRNALAKARVKQSSQERKTWIDSSQVKNMAASLCQKDFKNQRSSDTTSNATVAMNLISTQCY